MKKINWNYWIKVKLTPHGKNIYYHQFDNLIKGGVLKESDREYPKEDKDGYSQFQLWEFMQLYGPHIGMTLPEIIIDACIYFDDEYLEEVRDERPKP